jgi:hypothetical protein
MCVECAVSADDFAYVNVPVPSVAYLSLLDDSKRSLRRRHVEKPWCKLNHYLSLILARLLVNWEKRIAVWTNESK